MNPRLLMLLLLLPLTSAASESGELTIKGKSAPGVEVTLVAVFAASVDDHFCSYPTFDGGRAPKKFTLKYPAAVSSDGTYETKLKLVEKLKGDPFDHCRTKIGLIELRIAPVGSGMPSQNDYRITYLRWHPHDKDVNFSEIQRFQCDFSGTNSFFRCWVNQKSAQWDPFFTIPGFDPSQNYSQTIDIELH